VNRNYSFSQTIAETGLGEDSAACGLQLGTVGIIQALSCDVEQKNAAQPARP
jgi:hypothetical protein